MFKRTLSSKRLNDSIRSYHHHPVPTPIEQIVHGTDRLWNDYE